MTRDTTKQPIIHARSSTYAGTMPNRPNIRWATITEMNSELAPQPSKAMVKPFLRLRAAKNPPTANAPESANMKAAFAASVSSGANVAAKSTRPANTRTAAITATRLRPNQLSTVPFMMSSFIQR